MFYRAIETGTLLGFGAVTSSADISEGGQVVSPNENNRRTAAMRKLAATMPPAGTNTVLVSHKPNIMDAFGRDWFDVREGEASVFRPDGNGYKLVMPHPGRRLEQARAEWKLGFEHGLFGKPVPTFPDRAQNLSLRARMVANTLSAFASSMPMPAATE
jgi:hypothetical protein